MICDVREVDAVRNKWSQERPRRISCGIGRERRFRRAASSIVLPGEYYTTPQYYTTAPAAPGCRAGWR